MTLGDLIRSKGLKLKYVGAKLNERGVSISQPHFSMWCRCITTPKHKIVHKFLAEILDVKEEEIKKCFTK